MIEKKMRAWVFACVAMVLLCVGCGDSRTAEAPQTDARTMVSRKTAKTNPDSAGKGKVARASSKDVTRESMIKKDEKIKSQREFIAMALAMIVVLTGGCVWLVFRLYNVSEWLKKRIRKRGTKGSGSLFPGGENERKPMEQSVEERMPEAVEPEEKTAPVETPEMHWHHEAELRQIDDLLKDKQEYYADVIRYAQVLIDKSARLAVEIPPPPIETLVEEMPPRNLYFKEPNAEGYFLHSKRSFERNLTLYSFWTNPTGDEAFFQFDAAEPQMISQALSYAKYKIEPVCEMEGVHSERASKVTSVQAGEVKLNENGEWIVVRKARVQLS